MLSKPGIQFPGVVYRAFGDDSQSMFLASIIGRAQLPGHFIGRGFFFRNHYYLGATGKPSHQGKIATLATHHLDQKRALMRRCGCLEAIDGFEGNVQRRIHADRNLAAGKIVVDGRSDSHDRHSHFC